MKLRKHKNDKTFFIKYHFEASIPTGQRWDGRRMVPRSIEVKPVGHNFVLRKGNTAPAVLKAFKSHHDTTIRASIRLATEKEISSYYGTSR